MPIKSQAQMKWMYKNKPLMAAKWQRESPVSFKNLPKRVKKTNGRNKKKSKGTK